jgi:hypothetical protein
MFFFVAETIHYHCHNNEDQYQNNYTKNSFHNNTIIQSTLLITSWYSVTTMKIAYDFDGVLHRSVRLPDENGERPPYILRENLSKKRSYKPFVRVINQIKKQLTRGDNIYIITARSENFLDTIKTFLGRYFDDIDDIMIFCTEGKDKTPYLLENKIEEYYDDSCLRIKQIYSNRGQLPDLKRLYLVLPDAQTFVPIIIKTDTKEEDLSIVCMTSALKERLERLMSNNKIQQPTADSDSHNKITTLLKKLDENIELLELLIRQ